MSRIRDLIKSRGVRTIEDDLEDVGHVISESIMSALYVLAFFLVLGLVIGVGEIDQVLYWLWSVFDKAVHR